ncbi:MAG: hypothetical protein NTU61_03835 [Candidatus Altiarchaeota archaeon]|nr:hypothetical protein [Candidatus Altiarchaeota archaeon]
MKNVTWVLAAVLVVALASLYLGFGRQAETAQDTTPASATETTIAPPPTETTQQTIPQSSTSIAYALSTTVPGVISTFNATGEGVCTKDGKPIIRMYSTTTCPHCLWIRDTFDKVAKEYADSGKIIAYHWELNTYDDLITPAYEGTIPSSEIELFYKYNPRSTVPTFVFGCKYYRVGNGYESTRDFSAEEREFRYIIGGLINSSSN